uniref:Uncharacterized protein n=1 Tax=Musa acuminata subsp. malaccensis TaxID=214687 RepID=A0A804I857_MUSAM
MAGPPLKTFLKSKFSCILLKRKLKIEPRFFVFLSSLSAGTVVTLVQNKGILRGQTGGRVVGFD